MRVGKGLKQAYDAQELAADALRALKEQFLTRMGDFV
jgi:hypothetical protein